MSDENCDANFHGCTIVRGLTFLVILALMLIVLAGFMLHVEQLWVG
uniref:Uncharacterized protein n=1 Tax=Rhizobium rhizogenes TaxID=359 RepID=A0A7S4ZUT9_RHIRH|nr:hypothetical protein pC6.5d_682 [Rhizobium rhizogenes]